MTAGTVTNKSTLYLGTEILLLLPYSTNTSFMGALITICIIKHRSVINIITAPTYLMTLVPSISLVSDIFSLCIVDVTSCKINIKNFRNVQ